MRTGGPLLQHRVRHPSDVLRIAVGLTLLTLAALPVRPDTIGRVETGAFDLVNGLADWIYPPVYAVMQLGALGAVPALVIVALLLKRRSLALDIGLAGLVAWGVAHEVKNLFGRPRPLGLLDAVSVRGPEAIGLGFVSGHTAVAVAMATVISSYLPRRWRWAPTVVALSVGLSRIYVGAHLPLDVVGGAGLGWAIGALVHLVIGTPTGRPSAERVHLALVGSGLDVVDVEPIDVPAAVSAPFRATLADGRVLFVKAVGEELPDRDVIFRVYRWVLRRTSASESRFRAPEAQVQHEGLVALAAQRAGVDTPPLILVVPRGERSAILAFAWSDRPRIDEVDVDPALARACFEQLALLHAADIAHGAPNHANVLAGDGCAGLVDLGAGALAAGADRRRDDLAEMLVSIAGIADPAVVVEAAVTVHGAGAVSEALDAVTPARLTQLTRDELAADPDRLGALRAALSAVDPVPTA